VAATVHVVAVGLVVELLLERWTLPRLAGRLGVSLADGPQVAPRGRALRPGAAMRRWDAVGRVYRRWPRGDGPCLRQALVAGHLLRSRGPVLRIGVRRAEDGALQAHAWLAIDGTDLDPSAASWHPLDLPVAR
jgi:hypothetical protein